MIPIISTVSQKLGVLCRKPSLACLEPDTNTSHVPPKNRPSSELFTGPSNLFHEVRRLHRNWQTRSRASSVPRNMDRQGKARWWSCSNADILLWRQRRKRAHLWCAKKVGDPGAERHVTTGLTPSEPQPPSFSFAQPFDRIQRAGTAATKRAPHQLHRGEGGGERYQQARQV